MIIKLNGQDVETQSKTLQQLIAEQLDDTDHIAVAYNKTIIPQSSWSEQNLKDNDVIEIVHAIVGG